MKAQIRPITPADIPAVKELAKHIWDGHDYLQNVAAKWIKDGWFFGFFDMGKLAACVKISYLPGDVLWLEGLRVHPDYRGQGIAKLMNEAAMHVARTALESGKVKGIEFATYYKNEESIHIASLTGFKPVHEFFMISHPAIEPQIPRRFSHDYSGLDAFFPAYVPCGWKFIHPSEVTIEFLEREGKLYSKKGNAFYAGGDEPTIFLLSPAGEWLYEAMPVMQHLVGAGHDIDIIVDSHLESELVALQNLGFDYWEKGQQDKLSVFRYFPE
jgi:GNAT superfamily N-acetyltransferase